MRPLFSVETLGKTRKDCYNQYRTTGTMATTLGQLNPLRYRGYVYDTETGFYYVSSRYYDPEIGRWISPEPNVDYGEFDEGAGLVGYNVYAYCANNPVMFKDETGESITIVICGVVLGIKEIAAISAIAAGLICMSSSTFRRWFNNTVNTVVAGLKTGLNAIAVGAKTVAKSLSKSVAKAKTKIKKEKKKYDYWLAVYVDFGNGFDAYIPTKSLSSSQAKILVRSGLNVFASSREKAYKLAKNVGGGSPLRHPAHGGLGYWKHYHPMRKGKKIGGHVFYV